MNNNFATNLRKLRSYKGLTLEELGDKSGVNWKTINKYESGATEPTVSNLLLLASALGTTPDVITTATIELKLEIKR